jgi:FKBP-type peptidyl-prolyl cis-trans isomerase FkpA
MNRILLVLLAALTLGACSSDDNPTGPSSLEILEITVGTGAQAASGDLVSVYYVGAFLDGRVFDSRVSGTPLSFRLGTGAVIPGFEQGVIGMRVGGKRRVTVPSDLAYGRSGQGPIPPNTPLLFEIELLALTR